MVTIFPLTYMSQLALMVIAIKHGRQFAVWSGVESGDGEWGAESGHGKSGE